MNKHLNNLITMVQSISVLIEAVNLAQSRGAFLMNESANILPSLNKATEFVNASVKQAQEESKAKAEQEALANAQQPAPNVAPQVVAPTHAQEQPIHVAPTTNVAPTMETVHVATPMN